MSTNYHATVNGSFDFRIDSKAIKDFDVVAVSSITSHVLHQNASYHTEILSSNFNQKKYSVQVNGTVYDVVLTDALDALIKAMGFEVGATKQVNAIKAPMPGLILEISVSVGQTVKENESLLILEAMKMENNFLSPRDGIIKSISVNKGDTVDKGQLLVEFE
ncbi:acetyl-CoA carboxylase biotin carboxyl carrier protein subunit [Flavobacterium sp. TMP13]|uniref:acetyl-CoA carboxylase biotin carboxyl carrier protein subunit n=1 Tax=Flavobacterium sp. TMP13 TaxID=3425950 RepID=UPI003D773A43